MSLREQGFIRTDVPHMKTQNLFKKLFRIFGMTDVVLLQARHGGLIQLQGRLLQDPAVKTRAVLPELCPTLFRLPQTAVILGPTERLLEDWIVGILSTWIIIRPQKNFSLFYTFIYIGTKLFNFTKSLLVSHRL